MSPRVLGKRSHSSFSSPSPSRSSTPAPKSRRASVAYRPSSPDPTPNPKRAKTYSTEVEDDDGSNKENIAPEPLTASPVSLDASGNASSSASDASASITTMSPREQRASRRSSTQLSRSSTTPRRRVPSSSRPPKTPSSRTSASPPISKKGVQLRAEVETPSKTLARLSLSTPPPTPASIKPPPPHNTNSSVRTDPAAPHTLARALLRPQAHDGAPLVGREQERTSILEFLTPFLADKSNATDFTSLYVSGAPGTGKTALVNEVLKALSCPASCGPDAMDLDDASVRVLYVNCMALGAKDGITAVWERCAEEFGTEKKQRGAPNKLNWSECFGKLLQGQKCILVLDEIDHLSASGSGSISASHIFDIASTPPTRSSLRIIGISNTHTLTHSKPSAHTQTMHFEPYTAGQMKAVLSARLASLPAETPTAAKLFPAPTIALLTLKIANQTGDIRTVFSVARRALDIALAASGAPANATVTPAHVLAALKASNASMTASQGTNAEIVTRVRNLGFHARFALAALLLATKRVTAGLPLAGSSSGSLKENARSLPTSSSQGRDTAPAIDATALHGFYAAVLSRSADGAFSGLGRTEFGDLLGLLEGSGLVELAQGRGLGNKAKSVKGKGSQIVCVARGMREEELVRGLIGSTITASAEGVAVNVQEEEVKHVWEKETGRIGREVKARSANTNTKKADFDGAEED